MSSFPTKKLNSVRSRSFTRSRAGKVQNCSITPATFSIEESYLVSRFLKHPQVIAIPARSEFSQQKNRPIVAGGFCAPTGGVDTVQLYTGTNSILTLRPKARAALPSVLEVTEEFDASSSRSTAARLVFMRAAISALVTSFSFSKRPNCRSPPASRRAPRLLPGCLALSGNPGSYFRDGLFCS